LGDGGAVVTDDPEKVLRIESLRSYGKELSEPGINSRLDTLQAAFLLEKLEHLEKWNEWRKKCANVYAEVLPKSWQPAKAPYGQNYHLYVVDTWTVEGGRDKLQRFLQEKGIQTLIHYPVPLHLDPTNYSLPNIRYLKVAEARAKRILSLPMYCGLEQRQIEYIGEKVQEFFKCES